MPPPSTLEEQEHYIQSPRPWGPFHCTYTMSNIVQIVLIRIPNETQLPQKPSPKLFNLSQNALVSTGNSGLCRQSSAEPRRIRTYAATLGTPLQSPTPFHISELGSANARLLSRTRCPRHQCMYAQPIEPQTLSNPLAWTDSSGRNSAHWCIKSI